jgi:hypothetical protein
MSNKCFELCALFRNMFYGAMDKKHSEKNFAASGSNPDKISVLYLK